MFEKFSKFMKIAVERAKEIDDFGKAGVFDILARILPSIGWKGFLALTALLVMGKIAFGVTIITFLATPVGIAIGVVLGVAAAASIRKLYQNRTIPLSVKVVGERVKPKYNELKENRDFDAIDSLCSKTAQDIVNEAHARISKSVGRNTWSVSS